MVILGIETSCDETAAAVVKASNGKVKVLSNIVSSQVNIHKKYGGIVPEVAAREHVLQILPVINEALEQANLTPACLPAQTGAGRPQPPLLNRRGGEKGGGVDVIAVTIGPGLITSLLVGVETAKVLSFAWQVPVVGVNHIEGHIYANFIGRNPKSQIPSPKPRNIASQKRGRQITNSKAEISNIKFPAVILTVSGGHTMLVLMKGHGRFKTLGETRDDAAGEAFDKAAKLLNIGYPGGPAISAAAQKSKIKNLKSKIPLPRPMIDSKNFDFSFSGLKTALLYELKKDSNWKKRVPGYAYEFQQAVIDVLINKTIKAALDYKVKSVMLTGGVAANKELRKQLKKAVEDKLNHVKFYMPDLAYTTDNAAMIAVAGYFKAREKKFTPWQKLRVDI